MKWFITQEIGDLSQRLIDAGETVLSTPSTQRNPDDPDMEEPKDYNLRNIINKLEDAPDVIIFGNMNQPPFYAKGFAKLFQRKGGRVLMGGNDNDPTGLFYNNNRMVRCTMTTKQISVYLTNDPSVRTKLPRNTRVFDLNGDIKSLIRAAEDTLNTVGMGKLYV